jgi:hypothetical protein
MEKLCIPPQDAKKLIKAFQEGQIDITALTNADITSSEARRAVFEQYTDKRTAKYMNAELEKAIISDQKNALISWFKKVAPKEVIETEKGQQIPSGVLQKIESIKTVLGSEKSSAFLEDLAEQTLGIDISFEEASKIYELHEAMNKAYELDDFGIPVNAWWKARKELENYLDSLTPTSPLKVFFSTIGRGALLASIKSPITNIAGNLLMGLEQSIERRVEGTQLWGGHGDLMKAYIKKAEETFRASGFDITRMYSMESTRKILGEEIGHSQGKGVIRKIGRFYENTIFKYSMGYPDVISSAFAFADSLAMNSYLEAKREGLEGEKALERSKEIFLDATKIEPDTEAGKKLRFKAIADAEYATFQNQSWFSNLSMNIRQFLNDITGNVRAGDNLIPFAKTPANVIGVGVSAMGGSVFQAVKMMPNAIATWKKTGDGSKVRYMTRLLTRSGLGILAAFLIASAFEPEDYIGEYPTNATERELLRTQNASPNSIKIGNKWVSLDYFGFIGAPIVALMYTRKYGDSFGEDIVRFMQGGVAQILKIPGFEQLQGIIEYIGDIRKEGNFKVEELPVSIGTYLTDFMSARIMPSIIGDIAKVIDEYERKRDYTKPLEGLQTRVPWWREDLPARKTVFGEKIETESDLSILLFGSRIKTDKSNAITDEYIRLRENGNMPTLVSVETSSDRVKLLKQQLSQQKYDEAIRFYGKRLESELSTLIQSQQYKKLTDEEKKKEINDKRNDILEETLKKFDYKAPKKKK